MRFSVFSICYIECKGLFLNPDSGFDRNDRKYLKESPKWGKMKNILILICIKDDLKYKKADAA